MDVGHCAARAFTRRQTLQHDVREEPRTHGAVGVRLRRHALAQESAVSRIIQRGTGAVRRGDPVWNWLAGTASVSKCMSAKPSPLIIADSPR